MLSNQEISDILKEISEYLEMEDDPFRPRAYQKAARVVELQNRGLTNIYAKEGIEGLKGIPGIGEEIAKKIEELIQTGRLQYFEKLKRESPVDVSTLTKIEGLGPKKIKVLWKKLGVTNLDDLKKILDQHKIRELDGFGEKSESNIAKGIKALKTQKERLPFDKVISVAEKIKEQLQKLPEVKRTEIAGSLRRRKKTIGDIDLLVLSDKPEKVMKSFLELPQLVEIYANGKTKSSGRLSIGIDIDLRVVPEKSFGSALQYFTGSKLHNIKLRRLAQKKGFKLSEYGLFKKDQQIAGKDEKEIYKKLGTMYVNPKKRIGENEIIVTDTNIKEKSVGAVIFYKAHNIKHEIDLMNQNFDRGTKDNVKYLVLHYPPRNILDKKRIKPGHWDLVKGHIDKNETETETLFREIREETALTRNDLLIIDDFKEEIHYNFRTKNGLHYKTVVFYLVESKTKKVSLSYEHDDYKWLSFGKAYKIITFSGGKEMLKKAHYSLNNN